VPSVRPARRCLPTACLLRERQWRADGRGTGRADPHDPILDMFRLDGRVAIVTGAPPGSARSSPGRWPRRVPTSRSGRGGSTGWPTRSGGGGGGPAGDRGAHDVAVPEDCQALVDAAMAEFGRVDVLVNNAGVGTAARPPGRRPSSSARSSTSTSTAATGWRRRAAG
jgi:hypothetical protein